MSCRLFALAYAFLVMGSMDVWATESQIDFSRDVLPILSNNCFQCHGPDEANREAGLRLDDAEFATAELDSGERAVVGGNRQQSSIYARLTADDSDLRMPPVDTGKELSPDQVEIIGRWIDQGAAWSKHWAYTPPAKPTLPPLVDEWDAQNPIDRFVQAELKRQQLTPANSASRRTLIRRASLDLVGLPPTVEEVEQFVADDSPDAYSALVRRLLDSPRYGEHMARMWLDAARYADTHGLHLDNERSIWPYRDWVVGAFNRNLNFDQFTIEQLAGDLLQTPSLEQRVATGFNRCNVTTSEGGSIDDEYYVRYAVDRVETTSTVWLGVTAGCAACHDHKFDPLTQKEFYQLFSYFFNLTEKAMDGNALLPPPAVKMPSLVQQRKQYQLSEALAAAERDKQNLLDEIVYEDPIHAADVQLPPNRRHETVWVDDELPDGAKPSGDGEKPWQFVEAGPDHPVLSGQKSTVRVADGLSQQVFTDAEPGLSLGPHDQLFAYVYLDPENPPETVQLQFNDGSWEHRVYWGANEGYGKDKQGAANYHAGDLPETGKWVRLEIPAGAIGLSSDSVVHGLAFTQFKGRVHWDRAGKLTVEPLPPAMRKSLRAWEAFREEVEYPALPEDVAAAIKRSPDERTTNEQRSLRDYFLINVHPDWSDRLALHVEKIEALNDRLKTIADAVPSTLVMEDRPEPRQAHVLERGEYTLPRDPVDSQVPAWIAAPLDNASSNRLGLAQWLVDRSNPLTARVTVNRIWQQHFGLGLVKTSEDFGVQGERPSHPELLDWLACEFVDSGWNLKRLQYLILTSNTYQQSSYARPDVDSIDPENRLLARGPRHRLDAEVIRDQALSIGGLLINEIGGRSVKPYQPEGLWKPVGFGGSNTSVFKQDKGKALYRRSMYTFWKRTSPPPSMATFDAPNRETCTVRRPRTNTPLQSLVLMNDVQFVEAARHFAERLLRRGAVSDQARIAYAFQTVTSRVPNETELDSLKTLLAEYRNRFQATVESAEQLVSVGDSPRDADLAAPELAAWTMVAHLLLNLHETVTKG